MLHIQFSAFAYLYVYQVLLHLVNEKLLFFRIHDIFHSKTLFRAESSNEMQGIKNEQSLP
ncbi:hypothetical protein VFDL14_09395 [Vibrio fortis]|uniref:Uncharacterized protein n=1 Tax=Vibrio fortis TaxID=212667 RepID=A0A066US05_9VIBR|nr:hypothetical protein VFDL14_09395 [Vibrio fortis]